jgi:hypothetical protein
VKLDDRYSLVIRHSSFNIIGVFYAENLHDLSDAQSTILIAARQPCGFVEAITAPQTPIDSAEAVTEILADVRSGTPAIDTAYRRRSWIGRSSETIAAVADLPHD